MYKLELVPIGNSVGVVLPEEVLTRLRVQKGDIIFATDSRDGVMLLSSDPSLKEELKAGSEFMEMYSDTFRALAK